MARSTDMPTKPVSRRIGGTSRAGSENLPLPHERDESSTDAMNEGELNPVQAEQMEQARRDMESDQQNTDCRSMPQPEGSACPQPDSLPEPPRPPVNKGRPQR
jgi:hypothetical protein